MSAYHGSTQTRITQKFAILSRRSAAHSICGSTIIAVEFENNLVNEPDVSDLSEDRRTTAPELLGDDANSRTRHTPACDLVPFIHADIGVGAFDRSFFANDN